MTFFSSSGSVLKIGTSGVAVTFPWPVVDVLDFGNTLVVRLDPAPGARFNENVMGVGRDGKVIWQIPERKHVYDDSPYTGCIKDSQGVKAWNWDGGELLLDPHTGAVLSETYGK